MFSNQRTAFKLETSIKRIDHSVEKQNKYFSAIIKALTCYQNLMQ